MFAFDAGNSGWGNAEFSGDACARVPRPKKRDDFGAVIFRDLDGRTSRAGALKLFQSRVAVNPQAMRSAVSAIDGGDGPDRKAQFLGDVAHLHAVHSHGVNAVNDLIRHVFGVGGLFGLHGSLLAQLFKSWIAVNSKKMRPRFPHQNIHGSRVWDIFFRGGFPDRPAFKAKTVKPLYYRPADSRVGAVLPEAWSAPLQSIVRIVLARSPSQMLRVAANRIVALMQREMERVARLSYSNEKRKAVGPDVLAFDPEYAISSFRCPFPPRPTLARPQNINLGPEPRNVCVVVKNFLRSIRHG